MTSTEIQPANLTTLFNFKEPLVPFVKCLDYKSRYNQLKYFLNSMVPSYLPWQWLSSTACDADCALSRYCAASRIK